MLYFMCLFRKPWVLFDILYIILVISACSLRIGSSTSLVPFVAHLWVTARVIGLTPWYLIDMYSLKIKIQIFLDGTEGIAQNVQGLHVNCISKSATLPVLQCFTLLLGSNACGSERGNFWYRNLIQLLWKRVQKKDRQMNITASVPGSVGFPWQIILSIQWWCWFCM